MIGWIHTHPTQSPDPSAIDLHLQHTFQRGEPATLAIIVCKKFETVHVFNLSNDGVTEIQVHNHRKIV
jgi:proteasome lid subunit RPN8/RPN11